MESTSFLRDASWAERKGSTPLRIALTTFGILALELALIRWTSSQVRAFAYFNNIVLISAFLGMGLGVSLGRRYPGLFRLALPALLIVALPLAFSERLGLVHLYFPDNSIMLWVVGLVPADPAVFAEHILIFLALITAIVAVFTFCSIPLGYLFSLMPALRSYAWDLTGSLVGVVAFAVAAGLNAGPAVWLALGCLPFAFLLRKPAAFVLAIAIIALGQYSVRGALFSPYNRIDLSPPNEVFTELRVNRDFHQAIYDFSPAFLANPSLSVSDRLFLDRVQELYNLPFDVNRSRDSVLIVGAGTGNDVQSALRHGYRRVVGVDIDSQIIALGRALNPQRPYQDPRVLMVVDDARAFFGRPSAGTYDLVCYGLLDSHAMSSAMSTLRLDNYVYTEDGIRSGWNRVSPKGHLSLSMSCVAGDWFFNRMYWTIAKATGKAPRAFYSSIHGAVTFVVPRDGVVLDEAVMARRISLSPSSAEDDTLTTSDDWPFLYIRPGIFPWGYLVVLAYILLLALATVRPVFGIGSPGAPAFDWPLFFMGAAFLLVETRGVTSISLLFGSTWVANAAVFSGILIMVLAATLIVRGRRWTNPLPWFGPLLLSVALLWWFPLEWLQTLPLAVRGLLGGLLTGMPVGFAGIVVPMLLERSASPTASLGANLLGAVLGGCLEYYSMLGGLRSTAAMAAVLYLVALLLLRRKPAPAGAPLGADRALRLDSPAAG
jgi:hypothetical protein